MTRRVNEKGKGDCYYVAAMNVIENEGMTVVHADILGQGPLKGRVIGHAWNEVASGEIVIDQSNGHDLMVPAALYYALAKPKNIKKYSRFEAAQLVAKTGHSGPW